MSGQHDVPGFLGHTSQGVVAIHADWPIYPEEHGLDLALLWLTAFPQGTTFKRADDIDYCILLIADVKCSNRKDPFDDRNFHIALWHEDLLELRRKAFITGVEEGISWPEFSPEGLVVTLSGRDHAASFLTEAAGALAILGERVQRLLELSFFDTAVREACVALEHRIKTRLDSERWGDTLVEEFISRLHSDGKARESYLRILRGQIRTAFKFIRNDFMHNFVDIDETECRALLFRLARVRDEVEAMLSGAYQNAAADLGR